MRLPTFLILGSCIAALASGPASAAPKRTADKKAILAAVCEKGQIRKGTCRRARDYPDGRNCDIGLTGEGGEGRFLGTETAYLIAAYTSGCEPHANNWGGSLIFERGAKRKLLFLGYQPGMAVAGCVTTKRSGGDRLICTAGWMGQGFESEIIGEVVLAKDPAGKITAELQDLLTAGRSEDARGANTVECDKKVTFFGFGKVAAGPAPETIAVEAEYADEALIRALCAKPGRNAALGNEPPEANEAYIGRNQQKTGRFVYDLARRELLPNDEAAPQR